MKLCWGLIEFHSGELTKIVVKEWSSARTIFAFMFYATLCYMILKQFPVPDVLKEIVSFLMGFYFGQKQSANGKKEDVK